jgi:cytochrome c oxidase cbb3-type subunit I/II
VRDFAAPGAVTPANTYDHAFYRIQHELRHGIHRALEGRTVSFTVLVVLSLAVGSLVEAIPMFFNKANVKEIASVKPYTALEVVGRDIYIREGCYNCHSQLVRPFRHETERYGEYSKAGEYVYDHPFQWGSKRTGPDLHRVGGKYPSLWHVRHMGRPDSTTPGSVMPRYPHLLTNHYDTTLIASKLRALRATGVPYTDGEIETAGVSMERQAKAIAAEVESQQGPTGLADKEIAALTAYLQRLGTDIRWKRPASETPILPVATAEQARSATPMLPVATEPNAATSATPVATAGGTSRPASATQPPAGASAR